MISESLSRVLTSVTHTRTLAGTPTDRQTDKQVQRFTFAGTQTGSKLKVCADAI